MKIEFERFVTHYVDFTNKDTRRAAYERERAYVSEELNGDQDKLAIFDFFVFQRWEPDNLDNRIFFSWEYDHLYACTNAVGC